MKPVEFLMQFNKLKFISSKRLTEGGLALADQLVLSAVNFFIAFVLARILTEEDFGVYSLAVIGLVFLNNVQTALITQPHNVLGVSKLYEKGDRFIRYTLSVAVLQLGFAGSVSIVLVVAGVIISGEGHTSIGMVAYVLAPVVLVRQFQEFFRRILYTKKLVRKVFVNDLFSYGLVFILIVVLWWLNALTIYSALASLGVGALVGVIIGVFQLRDWMIARCTYTSIREALQKNWDYGGWVLAGTLLAWGGTQVYPVIVAGMLGIKSTAAFVACHNIVRLINPLMLAITSYVTPVAAEAATKSSTQLKRVLQKTFFSSFPLVVIVILFLQIFPSEILNILYGEKYSEYGQLLSFLGLSMLFVFVANILQLGLRALYLTRAIFVGFSLSVLTTLTVGVYFVGSYGINGAAGGLIASWIPVIIVFSIALYKSGQRKGE